MIKHFCFSFFFWQKAISGVVLRLQYTFACQWILIKHKMKTNRKATESEAALLLTTISFIENKWTMTKSNWGVSWCESSFQKHQINISRTSTRLHDSSRLRVYTTLSGTPPGTETQGPKYPQNIRESPRIYYSRYNAPLWWQVVSQPDGASGDEEMFQTLVSSRLPSAVFNRNEQHIKKHLLTSHWHLAEMPDPRNSMTEAPEYKKIILSNIGIYNQP